MKIKLLPFLLLCAIPLNPVLSIANEDYVVTGSRFTTPMNQIGYDVTVFTEEDIQNKQATTLDELLRHVAGITIVESGSGLASAFVRGGNSNSLLVLVDGIPISDPTQPNFDMNSIAIGTAERVEVLLGAQSAMYGAGAMAGVINIITKEGKGALNGSIYLEGGYPLNGKLQAQVNGSNDKLAYNLGLTGRYSNALNSTKPKNTDYYNDDIDPFYDINLNASVKYTASENFNIRLLANETYQDYAYDNGPWFTDDNATTLRSVVSVKPELLLFDGFWTQSLNLSYVNTAREYDNDSNLTNFASYAIYTDWQHKLALNNQNIAFGASYHIEQQNENPWAYNAQGEYGISAFAGYAEYNINPIDNLYLNLSGRLDKYDAFELGTSASFALAYTLPTDTFLHTSVGKAFGAPTLDQISGNSVELKPEDSFTWDLGLKQNIIDIAEISLSYYQANYYNLIAYTYGDPAYINQDKRNSQGINAGIEITPVTGLSLNLSATYEITKDNNDNKPDRLPDYTATLDADYILPFGDNAKVGFTIQHIAERTDIIYGSFWNGSYMEYTQVPTTLAPYTLLNFRAQADVIDNLTLFLKVNNILNQEYEEVYGYSTLGINANLGVKYVF